MNLLSMSLSASILILVILLARQLFLDKLPKFTFPILWLVVLIRLLAPYRLPSNFCLYNLLGQTNYERIIDTTNAQITSPLNVVQALSTEHDTIINPTTTNFKFILIIIWLIGVGISSSIYLYKYQKSIKHFKEAIDYTDPYIEKWKAFHTLKRKLSIKICDTIISPLTYRIFSPVILLPMTCDFEDTETMKFVLEHEYQHIRHFDQLFKYVMIVATCIHWFNPLVHLMFSISTRDIEARCDEAVLYNMGIKYKKDYATTLLNLVELQLKPKNLYQTFRTEPLEERILLIMRYTKLETFKLLGSIALISVLSISLATNVDTKVKQINKIITMGDHKVISWNGDTILTTDNSNVLFETTLKNRTLEKSFTISNKDGKYLGIVIENYADEPISYLLTGNEFIDQNGNVDYRLKLENTRIKNPDSNATYALPTYVPVLDELNDDRMNHYKIQIGNDSNQAIHAEVKIVVFNDPSDLISSTI